MTDFEIEILGLERLLLLEGLVVVGLEFSEMRLELVDLLIGILEVELPLGLQLGLESKDNFFSESDLYDKLFQLEFLADVGLGERLHFFDELEVFFLEE